jgi:hypothetical protein
LLILGGLADKLVSGGKSRKSRVISFFQLDFPGNLGLQGAWAYTTLYYNMGKRQVSLIEKSGWGEYPC